MAVNGAISVRQKLARVVKNPIGAAAIVVFCVFVYLYCFKFSGNIYGFFRIGDVLPFSDRLDLQKALIFRGELGFDGQQFLSIAFDPFLHDSDTLSTLDSPRLRYRRILYPLLGYILGFGNPQLIPYAMVGINVLVIILLVGVICQILKHSHRSAYQSLWALCIPGVWIVFALSTADLLNSLLGLVAIFYYKRQKKLYVSAALSAAFLTKEISVMLGVALILTSIRERNWKQLPYLVAAFIPAVFWHIYVLVRLKSQGFLGVTENFSYPFVGIGQKLLGLAMGELSGKTIFEAYSFFLLLGIFAANLVISAYFIKGNRIIFFATLLYGVLFVSSKMTMLGYFLNYPRQYIDVYFLLLVALGHRFDRLKWGLMAAGGLSSVAFLLAHT